MGSMYHEIVNLTHKRVRLRIDFVIKMPIVAILLTTSMPTQIHVNYFVTTSLDDHQCVAGHRFVDILC